MVQDRDIRIRMICLLTWRNSMLEISFTTQFKKDYKLCKKRGYDLYLLK